MYATNFFSSLLSNTLQFPYSNIVINHVTFLSSKPTKPNLTRATGDDDIIKSGNKDECKDLDSSSSSSSASVTADTFSPSGSAIKVPTAPWMKAPLLVDRNKVLDLSRPRTKKGSTFATTREPEMALNGKVRGGRGKKAMKKIFQSIEKLHEGQSPVETPKSLENIKFRFSPGELFGDEKMLSGNGNHMVVDGIAEGTETREEEIELDFLLGESEGELSSEVRKKMPWERDEKMASRRVKKEMAATIAELKLDGALLERLRGEAAVMKRWIKVKKAGVTQAVVDQIRTIWRNDELVMLKFDQPLCRNMERAHEIVEMKTGGVVVWNKNDALVVYRGCNYMLQRMRLSKISTSDQRGSFSNLTFQDADFGSHVNSRESSHYKGLYGEDGEGKTNKAYRSLYEREADRLLDGLGPRFIDWWWPKPLPVDADLLPEEVPGFKTPFRLCPPHAKPTLTNDELTYLRKLAHHLPTHFVLGRNRKLQGLASAILKLWEKSHIAKIAVKWGIPNTDNEQMANELKFLTGGVLVLRNKFFIILYRGKDFLTSEIADLVTRREKELSICQHQEEAARIKATETFFVSESQSLNVRSIGTLSEFQIIQSKCADLGNTTPQVEVQLQAEKQRLEKELVDQERKLFILKVKIEKSARSLAKLNAQWRPLEPDVDHEIITEEERECLRKIGLKMDSSIVLGRRGVFYGVIEGLHQHWKHREIVKVITMQRMFSQVMSTAKFLEAESGGILVSIDKLKEGHAIILYRGKNYRRPAVVPQNLLNKREALSRSIELQRIGSMKFFAKQKELAISDLRCKLEAITELINQKVSVISVD